MWEWIEMGIITMNDYAMERGDGEMRMSFRRNIDESAELRDPPNVFTLHFQDF